MADRDEITQSYLDALEALRGLAIRDLNAWWKDTQYHDFIRQRDLMRSPFQAIIKTYGAQTAHAAADYLFMKRGLDDTLRGLPYPKMAEPVSDERIEAAYQNVMWVKDLEEPGDRAAALSKLQALTKRLVVDPANETVYRATKSAGTAYARLPDPGCCAWCLMLASQGAVYHTDKTALIAESGKRFHDGCRCVAIEVNKAAGERSPKVVQEARGAWKELSKQLGGKTPTLAQWKDYLNERKIPKVDPKAVENTREIFKFPDMGEAKRIMRLSNPRFRQACTYWQSDNPRYFANIQEFLDGKTSGLDSLHSEILQELLDAAQETTLSHDVQLWRGVKNWREIFPGLELESLKGEVIDQLRFVPLSASERVAAKFSSSRYPNRAKLKVYVLKGTHGVWMPSNGDERFENQWEFLLPPGVKMVVKSVDTSQPKPVIEVVIYE